MRQDEMIFLGMQRKPKTEEEKKKDPIKLAEKTRSDRQKYRDQNWELFDAKKKELQEEIKDIEGSDIVDSMLEARRKYVQEWRQDYGKPPENLEKFYQKHNQETPLTAEEEEKAKAEEDEGGKGKKAKKDKKPKGKKKGGGGDDDDGGEKLVKIGPSEVVTKFDEFY